MMAKEGEAFSKMIMKMGRKQSVRVPRSINKKCDLSEGKIGKHRYFVISKKDAKPRRAVLYLFGGGYVLPPDKGDFLFAVETAEATDAEVWFPVYPLLPRYKLVDAVRMVMEIYGMMLERFPAEQITFIGFSSGAALACSVCIQNKQEGFRYPMPSSLILVSSGTQLPPSGEQMREMERLAPKDPMIPPSFFQNIGPLLAAQEDRYLLSPALYDLTGFP
ncbi:alpha/beta hydrolase, partial [Methanoculleus sp. UBA331]